MFQYIETPLRDALDNTIPGVPVMGTLDRIDLTGPGSPVIAMQVKWYGAPIAGKKRGAVNLAHLFGLHIYVDSGRARRAEQETALAGLRTALQRILVFQPERLIFADPRDIPAPEEDAKLTRLSIYFSFADAIAGDASAA